MMLRVGPANWPPRMTPVPARSEAGFRLPPSPAALATAAVARPEGLLPLGGAMPTPRDVLARRRGRALLGGLGALQRALLAGKADAGALRSLAGLVDGEDGDDPDIADAMRALALRARIELARAEAVTTSR